MPGQGFPGAVLSQPLGITARLSAAAHTHVCAWPGYASACTQERAACEHPRGLCRAGKAAEWEGEQREAPRRGTRAPTAALGLGTGNQAHGEQQKPSCRCQDPRDVFLQPELWQAMLRTLP